MKFDSSFGDVEMFNRHNSVALLDEFLGITADYGQGALITSSDGANWLDMASGGFGYGVDHVNDRVLEQISKMALSNRILISRRVADLVFELSKYCPGSLSVSYICNSGEEAFDGALKLAKGYNPERKKICVVSGSNVGCLTYGIYLRGINEQYLKPYGVDIVRLTPESLEEVNAKIDEDVFAVVFEPVLFVDGIHPLSKQYLEAIRKKTQEVGCLMIDYEVRTGLGFTGSNLAIEATNVIPDVAVLGGALSGGAIPVGAYVTKKEINDMVYASKNPSLHGSTTGGNPASCAAAIAAISYCRLNHINNNHKHYESYVSDKLESLLKISCNTVIGFHILGGMSAIKTSNKKIAMDIWQMCFDLGLVLRKPESTWLYFFPPLIVSEGELDNTFSIVENSVKALVNEPATEVML